MDMQIDQFITPQVVRSWWHANLRCLVALMPKTGPLGGWYTGYVRIPTSSGLPSDYRDAPEDLREGPWRELTFSGTPVGSVGLWYGFDLAHSFDFRTDVSGERRNVRTETDAVEATESLADAIAAHIRESGGNPDDHRCFDCHHLDECYPNPDLTSWNWGACVRFESETDDSVMWNRTLDALLMEAGVEFSKLEWTR